MRQPAPRCAHPAAEPPELRSKIRIILVLQHLRLHIGEESPVARLKSRVRGSWGKREEPGRSEAEETEVWREESMLRASTDDWANRLLRTRNIKWGAGLRWRFPTQTRTRVTLKGTALQGFCYQLVIA